MADDAYDAESILVAGLWATLEESRVDALGRAASLGFTEAVLAWPRPTGAVSGEAVLVETMAARLPEVHAL